MREELQGDRERNRGGMMRDTPMIELKDRGELIDPDDSRFYLEIDDGQAIICFADPLDFHAKLARADEQRLGEHVRRGRNRWDDLTEGEFLTAESGEKLAAEMQRILNDRGIDATVHYADHLGGDEPSIGVEIVTDVLPGETFGAWVDRIGWPVVATVANATDPGTFMFPYLFSAILYR